MKRSEAFACVVLIFFLLVTSCAPAATGKSSASPRPFPPEDPCLKQGVNYARADQEDFCFFVETGSKAAIYELFKFPQPSRPPLDPSLERNLPAASLYIFRNGVRGDGPNGLQLPVLELTSDVQVDRVITRALLFVSWNVSVTARELKSAREIRAAEADRQLAIEPDKSVLRMLLVGRRQR